jgi:hypothetical protein
MLEVIIGLTMILGVVQCFFGYRIFKFVLGFTGFILGGLLAGAFAFSMSGQEVVSILAALVGGVVGAVMLVPLYFVGVFFVGALLGATLGAALLALADVTPGPVLLLISGVLVGAVALVFQKFLIIASTSFVGSWSVVTGVTHFVSADIDLMNPDLLLPSPDTRIYLIVLWIGLALAGVLVQYRALRSTVRQREPERSATNHGDPLRRCPTCGGRGLTFCQNCGQKLRAS